MSLDDYPLAVLGLLSVFILSIGFRKGFFRFSTAPWEVPLKLRHLIGAFSIYFGATYFGSGIAIFLLKRKIMLNYMGYSSWLNFGISLSVFLLLALYMKLLPKPVSLGILRNERTPSPLSEDLRQAIYAWLLSFPLVLFLSQTLETLVSRLFHVSELPEQLAVKFLKSSFYNPIYFTQAVISIVILAPLIEETLFRGFLQTYIRQHLGSRQAILITSVCFSLFHYAAGQGLGNISIILSLFILALFLGFLYEKQGSLFSPILLHASFNMISVVNLYLFGGFTTGL